MTRPEKQVRSHWEIQTREIKLSSKPMILSSKTITCSIPGKEKLKFLETICRRSLNWEDVESKTTGLSIKKSSEKRCSFTFTFPILLEINSNTESTVQCLTFFYKLTKIYINREQNKIHTRQTTAFLLGNQDHSKSKYQCSLNLDP